MAYSSPSLRQPAICRRYIRQIPRQGRKAPSCSGNRTQSPQVLGGCCRPSYMPIVNRLSAPELEVVRKWKREVLGAFGSHHRGPRRTPTLPAGVAGGSGSPAGGSPGAGAGVFGEVSVRHADDAGADRAPADRRDAAAPVRLDAGGGGAERGDVLAGVRSVYGDRAAGAGLVAKTLRPRLVGHIIRDATAIPAREKATRKPPKRRRGRRRRASRRSAGAVARARASRRRLERQQAMTLAEIWRTCRERATSARSATRRGTRRLGSATSSNSMRRTAGCP